MIVIVVDRPNPGREIETLDLVEIGPLAAHGTFHVRSHLTFQQSEISLEKSATNTILPTMYV